MLCVVDAVFVVVVVVFLAKWISSVAHVLIVSVIKFHFSWKFCFFSLSVTMCILLPSVPFKRKWSMDCRRWKYWLMWFTCIRAIEPLFCRRRRRRWLLNAFITILCAFLFYNHLNKSGSTTHKAKTFHFIFHHRKFLRTFCNWNSINDVVVFFSDGSRDFNWRLIDCFS